MELNLTNAHFQKVSSHITLTINESKLGSSFFGYLFINSANNPIRATAFAHRKYQMLSDRNGRKTSRQTFFNLFMWVSPLIERNFLFQEIPLSSQHSTIAWYARKAKRHSKILRWFNYRKLWDLKVIHIHLLCIYLHIYKHLKWQSSL